MLPDGDNELEQNIREVYIEHWSAIRTHNYPIGSKIVELPDYITKNRAITGLAKDKYSKYEYQDNLCFFRALAIHQGVPKERNLQIANAVQHLLSLVTNEDPSTFEGVQLQDLPDMEVKFELNIMVFQLIEKEDGQVVAQIVQ